MSSATVNSLSLLALYDRLRGENQSGARSCEDFLHFMNERAKLEDSYAKALNKLSRHAMGVAETTGIKEAFQKVKNDLCNEAHQHEILAQSIRVDVIAPIERLLDDYTEVHAVVDRVQHSLTDVRASYDKCVKSFSKYGQLYSACIAACHAAVIPPPPAWDPLLTSDDLFGLGSGYEQRSASESIDRDDSSMILSPASSTATSTKSYSRSSSSIVSSLKGMFVSEREKPVPVLKREAEAAMSATAEMQLDCQMLCAKYAGRKLEFLGMLKEALALCGQYEGHRFRELHDAIRRYIVFESSVFANCQYDVQEIMKVVDGIEPPLAATETPVTPVISPRSGVVIFRRHSTAPAGSSHPLDMCVRLIFDATHSATLNKLSIAEAKEALGIDDRSIGSPSVPRPVSLDAFAAGDVVPVPFGSPTFSAASGDAIPVSPMVVSEVVGSQTGPVETGNATSDNIVADTDSQAAETTSSTIEAENATEPAETFGLLASPSDGHCAHTTEAGSQPAAGVTMQSFVQPPVPPPRLDSRTKNLLQTARKALRTSGDGLARFTRALVQQQRVSCVVPSKAAFEALGSLMLVALDLADQRCDYERARLLMVASQTMYFQLPTSAVEVPQPYVPALSMHAFLAASTPQALSDSPGYRRRSSSAFLMEGAMNPSGTDAAHPDRLLLQSQVQNHRIFQSLQYWESAAFDALGHAQPEMDLLAENDVDAPTKTIKAISVAQLQRFSGNMLRFGVPLDHVNTLLNKFAQFVGLTKPELDMLLDSVRIEAVAQQMDASSV